jgi:methionyl-tRNA formyltransferase
MKLVYMGTPEFARVPLTVLAKSHHTVLAVVTGQDKAVGRGRTMQPTPVKTEAERLGLPVFTPRTLKSPKLRDQLEAFQADLFVVVAFRILPESLFTVPKLGSINVHGSLLPKYRGAAPINWALINGEGETGLSAFYLKPTVDTGDVIAQQRIAIESDDTFDTLYARMAEAAGPFLVDTLDRLENGTLRPSPQDDSAASGAPKLTPEDGLIDFGFPGSLVVNFVRGMSSKPGAYSWFRGRKIKILGARQADEPVGREIRPGTILPHKKRLLVACATSAVELTRLVPEGKKEMDGVSFLNGMRPEAGELFGQPTTEGLRRT